MVTDGIRDTGSRSNHFATMILLAIDLQTGKGLLANAGHLPAFRSGGHAIFEPGHILGQVHELPLTLGKFQLDQDDILMLISDGIIDNKRQGRGTLREFRRVVRTLPKGMNAESVKKYIVDHAFSGIKGQALRDDMTLIVVRWIGNDIAVC